MNYKIQPGVVLKSICDEHILIATGLARGVCPAMQVINVTGAYYWKLLAAGKTTEELIAAAAEDYKIPAERIAPGLQNYLESMAAQHFLIPLED